MQRREHVAWHALMRNALPEEAAHVMTVFWQCLQTKNAGRFSVERDGRLHMAERILIRPASVPSKERGFQFFFAGMLEQPQEMAKRASKWVTPGVNIVFEQNARAA